MQSTVEPIAIVGMGCRWPGGVKSPSQLWELLKEKRSGWREFEPDHINSPGFYHPNSQRLGGMVTKGGYLLNEDPRQFDNAFFGISATEAMSMDPSQRKLLEVTFEAFESAGEPLERFYGSRTGVFVGNFNNDHQLMQFRDQEHTLPYVSTGGGPTILSNRINYVFNLLGPSMVVDTGCSASMYALHLAVTSLRNGDCDAAIVAGSNIILGPDNQIWTSRLGAASPSSKCHTFDISADGYGRAEGFGAIYLKKMSDAVARDDPIRALVRGTSFNANGKTGGISHPSAEGQEAVIRQAYKAAGGLDPNMTGYFECHGTGTPVGDPVEVSALGKVFASGRDHDPLLIGSIKPNLGHSEAASAMSQIMKAILAMEHDMIPATIGIEKFNPAIDFGTTRTKVVTDMTPWPNNLLRRVSINSFGYGGANAHCIIDHPSVLMPGYQLKGLPVLRSAAKTSLSPANGSLTNGSLTNGHSRGISNGINGNGHTSRNVNGHSDGAAYKVNGNGSPAPDNTPRPYVLLPFSAHDEKALKANVTDLSQSIKDYDLNDLLYTLEARKSKFARRAFAVAEPKSLVRGIDTSMLTVGKIPNTPVKRVGFVFTGQGAQWPEMGAKLIGEYAVVRDTIAYMDDVLGKLSQKPSWTIEEALLEPAETSRIHEPAVSQLVCTAVQIALVRLLKLWGINPTVNVGHSSGEIAAAYASGRLRASEAIVLAYFRGQVVAKNERKGLMLAVGVAPQTALSYLVGIEEDVRVAAINSPASVTLSGEPDAIRELSSKLSSENIFNRVLKTGDNAYHSHHMAALGEEYEALASQGLREIASFTQSEETTPQASWVSSVTPQKTVESVAPNYWRRNLESPVLFSQAVQVLAREVPADLFVEIGPHPALSGLFKQIRSVVEENGQTLAHCLGSLRRGEHDILSMLTLAGNLFLQNAPVNLLAVNATEHNLHESLSQQSGHACVDLPLYNFTYPEKPLYHENRFSREFKMRKHPRHDLLGARVPGGSRSHPAWRNVLRLRDVPWLADHKLLPYAVLPAAAYIAMAVEAVTQIHFEEEDALPIVAFKLRNVAINSTLRVPDDELGVETILNMEKVALTDTRAMSRWYRFSIGSIVAGSQSWTDHCQGNICVETRQSNVDQHRRLQIDQRSRSLDIKRWYEKFADAGLGYGPAFQGLSRLQAYHGSSTAGALVNLDPTKATTTKDNQTTYAIHPATLDTCIQLALIAVHSGQVENLEKSFVPVNANDVTIWSTDTLEEKGQGVANGKIRGSRSAYAKIQLFSLSGSPLLDIGEMRVVTHQQAATQPTREPYWRPVERIDIDTLTTESARSMFPPTENSKIQLQALDYFSACIVADIGASLESETLQKYVEKHQEFAQWIKLRQAADIKAGFVAGDAEERKEALRSLCARLDDVPEAKCLKQLHGNLENIFEGQITARQTMMEEGLLSNLYASGIAFRAGIAQLQRVVDLTAHKNPRMRILVIGGGVGATTSLLLDTLAAKTPFQHYQEFAFTDSAPWCVEEARTKFADCHQMAFNVLDIEKNPSTQGFESHQFDLVVSTGCLGQAKSTSMALQNVHSLLKPNGKLALLEFERLTPGLELLMRVLAGNWSESEFTGGAPRWGSLLGACGYSGIDLSLNDYLGDQSMAQVILTTALHPDIPEGILSDPHPVYLVYRDYPAPLTTSIGSILRGRGLKVFLRELHSCGDIPQHSPIISLVDIESTTLIHRDEDSFKAIQEVIMRASTVLWLAFAGRDNSVSEPAIMKGLLRSIATENVAMKVGFVEMDLDFCGSLDRTAELVCLKFSELVFERKEQLIDKEWKLKNGAAYIERLLPDDDLNDEFRLGHSFTPDTRERSWKEQGPLRANYKQPGVLSSLYFSPDRSFEKALPEDWVEIQTKAIGLNMKDLAVATGRFDLDYLSSEVAGVVCKTGAAVTSLKTGDRVFGIVPGNMGNFTRSKAALVKKVRDGESLVNAASMPLVYVTAIYAFRHLARLTPGESVLIQSATGGLGMAAVHIAKSLGTEIYATAGNAAKRKILIDTFDIPADHIFSSREVGAVDDILRATEYKGIDVILSATGGDTMHEIWRCIAPSGRFIDVGRTDVLGAGQLGLEVFQRNATFSSFDLGLLYRQKPDVIEKLMVEMKGLWDQNVIGPIGHVQAFDISELEQAMVYFSKASHTGKIVISFEDPTTQLKITRAPKRARFDPKAAYILVGCLGGLGRSIAAWMIERGARHLVFLSRSGAASTRATNIASELRNMGALPDIIKCNVSDLSSLSSVIEDIARQRPVKGVFHAAMVEGDSFFDKARYSQIHGVLAPKVTGSINLHHATAQLDLDFFIMTSSIVGCVGTASQGAYVAANSFQDSFARFRRARSLPATAFSLGLILEIGSVSESYGFQQMLQRTCTYGMSEAEFLQHLDTAFTQTNDPKADRILATTDPFSSSQVIMGLEPSRFVPYVEDGRIDGITWRTNSRFQAVMQAIQDRAQSRASAGEGASDSSAISDHLKRAKSTGEKLGIARNAIVERIGKLLSIEVDEIDANMPLSHYGLDSLVAAELRNWFITALGVEVPLLHLLSKTTKIEDVVGVVVNGEKT